MPLAVSCQSAGRRLCICRSTNIQVCTMLLDGVTSLQRCDRRSRHATQAPKKALELPHHTSSKRALWCLAVHSTSMTAHEPLTGLLCSTCTRPRPFSSLSLCSWCSRDSACSWASTSFCLSRAAGAQGRELSVRSRDRRVCTQVASKLADQPSPVHPCLKSRASPTSMWGHCSCQVPAAGSPPPSAARSGPQVRRGAGMEHTQGCAGLLRCSGGAQWHLRLHLLQHGQQGHKGAQ